MTLASLPSITETTLFVVPRSIPIILPIALTPQLLPDRSGFGPGRLPSIEWRLGNLEIFAARDIPDRPTAGNIIMSIAGSRSVKELRLRPQRDFAAAA